MITARSGRPLTVPTVHLNGTSKDSLIKSLTKAYDAVRVAQQALHAAGPNARDYYIQAPDALHYAQEEHLDRLKRLASVHLELEALIIAIDEQ